MKRFIIVLMLLLAFSLLADDYYTNNPRHWIVNPDDGDILSWNSTLRAFDCAADADINGTLTANIHSIGAGEYTLLPTAGTLTTGQYAGARVMTLTAGYTTAIGDLVYLGTDGEVYKTDGNAAATAADVLVGVALEVSSDGNSCLVMLEGTIMLAGWDFGATIGKSAYISGTEGEFTATKLAVSLDIVRIMGYVLDDDTIYFCPSNSYATVE